MATPAVSHPSADATPAKAMPDMAGGAKSPPTQAAVPNLPPELTNNPQYEIVRELGRGGMGVVYPGKNRLMDRFEVLKVVNKSLLDHPGSVERFHREIRSAAKLSHANVLTAYSAVQQGELLAFAMEYVEGQDLASLRVQSRINQDGNSGVFFRCKYGLSSLDDRVPNGYEAEIDEAETGTLRDWSRGVAELIVRRYPISPNQWFLLEVIFEGDRIVILVNDQKAVEKTLPTGYRKRGHIALQQFTPETVVEFRKIEIKELSARPSPPGAADSLPPEAREAAKAYEKACAEARAKLLAEFDTTVERLTKMRGSTDLRLRIIEIVKQEKKRFENNGLIHWSKWMRTPVAGYLTSTTAADERLHRAYNSLIDSQLEANKEKMADDLRADLKYARNPQVVAKWKYFLNGEPKQTVSLYSNGRVRSGDGKTAWFYVKGELILRYPPDPNAPGGEWIDFLQVSDDGTTFAGTNNTPAGKARRSPASISETSESTC